MATEGEGKKKEIVWNEKGSKFQTTDGEAYLVYHHLNIKIMEITHTYVPPTKRGLGLASRLCDAAFTHAHAHSLAVVPSCSYVSDTYLPRNPNWESLVYKGKGKGKGKVKADARSTI